MIRKHEQHIRSNDNTIPGALYHQHQAKQDEGNVKLWRALIIVPLVVVAIFFIDWAFDYDFRNIFRKINIEITSPIGEEPSAYDIQNTIDNMTVPQAYAQLHGQVTAFVPTNNMSELEGRYLKDVFDLVNVGVVERARVLAWHQYYSEESPALFYRHERIIEHLDDMSPPPRLEKFHSLLVYGFAYQKEYFYDWQKEPEEPFSIKNDNAQKSHQYIYASYNNLLSVYNPDRDMQNVFFQHLYTLCLD